MGSSQQSDRRDLSDSSSPANNFLPSPPALSHQCLCQPGECLWFWTHFIMVDFTHSNDLTYKTKCISDLLAGCWFTLDITHWTVSQWEPLCANTVRCVFICLGDGCGGTLQRSRWPTIAALKSLPLPSSPIQHGCGSLGGHADPSNALSSYYSNPVIFSEIWTEGFLWAFIWCKFYFFYT